MEKVSLPHSNSVCVRVFFKWIFTIMTQFSIIFMPFVSFCSLCFSLIINKVAFAWINQANGKEDNSIISFYGFISSSWTSGFPMKEKKIPTTNKQYLLMAWRKWNSPRVSAFFGRKQGDFKSPRTSSKFYFTFFANAIIRATRRAPLGQNKLR